MKKQAKNGIFRLVLAFLSFIIQVIWLLVLGSHLKKYSTAISFTVNILSLLFVIYIYNKRNSTTTFKLPWIILILVFPFTGIILYVLWGKNFYTKNQKNNISFIKAKLNIDDSLSSNALKDLKKDNKLAYNQFFYLFNSCNFNLYQNTSCTYYSYAYDGFLEQLADMEKAKEFIFMEYHAFEQDSKCFNMLMKVLRKKVQENLLIRVLYDDVGSIGFVDLEFKKFLESEEIECRTFNPVSPMIRLFMNNRDHRKITIIDGKIGYTGGYNIADEYFGFKTPYGRWKDTGIRIEGPAVNSLTKIFLELWINPKKDSIENNLRYLNKSNSESNLISDGYIQPYSDMPLDDNYVGENVYMNMIKSAKNYIYITTPYLILGDEMVRELVLAVRRGIDVRIVTPGIPDKKIVYRITRSNYAELLNAGIKIYEYTPGFIHSKQMLVDGEFVVIGTINMDFRSFYHHFENGVLIYKSKIAAEMEKDFTDVFEESTLINDTGKFRKKLSFFDSFIRLFSPLL